MKISNPLMCGFYSGLIAGIFGGLGNTFFMYTVTLLGFPTTIGLYSSFYFTLEGLLYHLGYSVPATAIFGAIFGIIYSALHKRIPYKNIVKGLIFGLIVFLFSNVYSAHSSILIWLLTAKGYNIAGDIGWFTGILLWVIYGIVLGALYERWS
ncbi:hypothetical protein [[Eubacterium] cellulosolvens]